MGLISPKKENWRRKNIQRLFQPGVIYFPLRLLSFILLDSYKNGIKEFKGIAQTLSCCKV